MTAGRVSNNCDRRLYSLSHRRHASVNLVNHSLQHGRPRRREQNLIVRSRKSEAEVTSIRILRSMYCAIEASY